MPSIEGEALAAAMACFGAEFGADAGAHGTARAEVLGERAGVDALDAENAVRGEIIGQRLAWSASWTGPRRVRR